MLTHTTPSLRSVQAFRGIAWAAAVACYGLVVLGGVVRITGSGMGCGDHWPKCNGRWLPPLGDVTTLIEWTHRLFAAVVAALVTLLMVMAFLQRRHGKRETGSGKREAGDETRKPGREAYVAFGLLETQILLGAITVKLELPAWSVVLHFATAMLLLATLLTAALSASPASPAPLRARGGRGLALSEAKGRSGAVGGGGGTGELGVALAFVVVILGALTANTGASRACWGFPLCNGEIWPTTSGLAQLQWIHRLGGFALAGWLVAVAWRSRGAPPAARAVATLAAVVAVAQLVVAALLVLRFLPTGLRALHLAVGTAVWALAVWSALLARHEASDAPAPIPESALSATQPR